MLQRQKALWRGIRRHGTGWQIEVRVTGHPRFIEQHPLDATRDELQKRRAEVKRALRAEKPKARAGTFASDVPDYLKARAAMPGIRERARHMALWVAEFGHLPSDHIKPHQIMAVRDRWLTVGPKLVTVKGGTRAKPKIVALDVPLSASQVNNRLRALENFYTVMFGRHGYNPVREVEEPKEPTGQARGLPYDVVEQIIGSLRQLGKKGDKRPSLTALRLRAIAYTGLSHGELMRVTAADLHLDESPPWVRITGRGKGKGTTETAQPLTEQGAAALRALAAVQLGPFSRHPVRRAFAAAARRLGLDARPYDLRHSFASEVLEKTGGNLPVTQLLMRHRSQATTLRYGQKAIDPVRAAAIEMVRKSGGFAPENAPAVGKLQKTE